MVFRDFKKAMQPCQKTIVKDVVMRKNERANGSRDGRDFGYDLKSVPTDDLKRLVIATTLSRGIYGKWQYGEDAKYALPGSDDRNLLQKGWDMVKSAGRAANGFAGFLTENDAMVGAGYFDMEDPGRDPFNLSVPTGRRVLVIAFKGSDDLVDFVRDPSAKGVGKALDEARDGLFEKTLFKLKAAVESGDDVLVTGHSLGGFLASEFAMFARDRMGGEWWGRNGGKISLATIDGIGFGRSFSELTRSGSMAPMEQIHMAVDGSIAQKSRDASMIRATMGGNGLYGGEVLQSLGSYAKFYSVRAPSWDPTGVSVHKTDNISTGLAAELFSRQKESGLTVGRPDMESVSPAKISSFRKGRNSERQVDEVVAAYSGPAPGRGKAP